MSVVIPGMNMPMSCLSCPLAREMFGCLVCVGYFKDNLTGRRVYKSDLRESDTDFNRPDWCPLVPLPEGHGRLIDADALAARFKKQIVNEDDQIELCKRAGLMGNYFNESKVQIGMISFMRMLNDAATIVPAEGGEADG